MKAKIPANIERDLRNIERETINRHAEQVREHDRTGRWHEPRITQDEYNRSESIWSFIIGLIRG
jgi:hypothetical protein